MATSPSEETSDHQNAQDWQGKRASPSNAPNEKVPHGETESKGVQTQLVQSSISSESESPPPPEAESINVTPLIRSSSSNNGWPSDVARTYRSRDMAPKDSFQSLRKVSSASTGSSQLFTVDYVTVSSVLSRSGSAIVPRYTEGRVNSKVEREEGSWLLDRSSSNRRQTLKRQASNGSALEAFGALFLQRDSSGRVSNLSFARGRDTQDQAQAKRRGWIHSITGRARFGIRMPSQRDAGQTIAQRRARKQENRSAPEFKIMGTKDTHPTFEVLSYSITNMDGEMSSDTPVLPPAPQLKGSVQDEPSPFPKGRMFGSPDGDAMHTSHIYGAGSAFNVVDPPEAPPSPVGMPGAWTIGERLEEGALLLPPPLLDNEGSDPQSFEGLLGIHRMREREKARKQLELLKLRNRPAHKVGMLTAFSNFVKAAHASDRAAKAVARAQLNRTQTEPSLSRASLSKKNGEDQKDISSIAMTRSSSGEQHPLANTRVGQKKNSLDGLPSSEFEHNGLLQHALPRKLSSEGNIQVQLVPRRTSISTFDHSGKGGAPSRDAYSLKPLTPCLNPTLLSEPPSPWTPYVTGDNREKGDTKDSQHSVPFHWHLGMTPVHGPPGTPRLAPAHLEMSPLHLSTSELKYSSNGSAEMDGMPMPSPFTLSPIVTPHHDIETSALSSQERLRRRGKDASADMTSSPRLTPSSAMQRPTWTDSRVNTLSKDSFAPPDRSKVAPQSEKRSFLIWFFLGDLGKRRQSHTFSGASSRFHIILVITSHFYDFTVFVLAHLVDLGYRAVELASLFFWFLRWVVLNLTGQTVLSQCVRDAYRLISREWATVSMEDHEEKGTKASKVVPTDDQDENHPITYKGLSRWQVIKGIVELVCLQDVTRERYLQEGAGLQELIGWQKRSQENNSSSLQSARKDASKTRRSSLFDDNSQFSHDSDSDTSDDDMLVTRKETDILEFTKTPKVEASERHEINHKQRVNRSRGNSDSGANVGKFASREIVRVIKWASRLSISAYGLHVTLVDLPATFTPSGNRFSRQTFAHLSRLHHEDVLHADIQTLDAEDYSPTFYLVRDMAKKVIAVSVRGTQSLQDIIVDLEMVVDQVHLHKDDKEEQNEPVYCHAGVLRAAKALIAKDSSLFQILSQALEENPTFDIVFTGHSLGGAIASTVVLLLSRYEQAHGDKEGYWVTHEHSGLPVGRHIRAITFAHPATASANLAARASRGNPPLVLSITLGHDIIPRCGHGQARELRRALGALSRVRRRRRATRRASFLERRNSQSDKHEDIDSSDARVHIFTSWWRWRAIKKKGPSATTEETVEMKRITDELWRLRCDVEGDLYAAIKRRTIAMNDESSHNTGIPPSPWIGPSQRAGAPLHQLAARRQALDAITLANEESISKNAGGVLVPVGKSIWVYDGRLYEITSPLSFFSLPDFHVSLTTVSDSQSDPFSAPNVHPTFPCSVRRLPRRSVN